MAGIARDGAAATTKPPAATRNATAAARSPCCPASRAPRTRHDRPTDIQSIADP